MTKAAALYDFFSSFGLPAYADTAVPDDAEYPYLTYNLVLNAWDGGETAITVNLWDRTTKESTLNALAEQISETIGIGGKVLSCDLGYVWLKRGNPFCQSLVDEQSSDIKRRYINISAEYLTLY
jgi:hypothetical protein